MFNPTTLVGFHTIISFVAIFAGLFVIARLTAGSLPALWTEIFLATAVITSATGFLFPFHQLLPSHIVGAIALLVLAATLLAQYVFHFSGPWRTVYAVGIVASLYLLIFVLIAQAFMKIGVLNRLAPTQSEAPFAVAQLVLLVVMVWVGFKALRAFQPGGWVSRP
jgi:hypothetical protein